MPACKTTLFIVRHGQSTWNLEKRWQGQTETSLTDLGHSQARSIAQWFQQQRHVPDHVYSSDLKRALDTAETVRLAICPEIPIRKDPRLRELSMGCFEGLSAAQVQQSFPEAFRNWMSQRATYKIPAGDNPRGQGESGNEFRARVREFCGEVVQRHPGKVVAIACHGGTIEMMRQVFKGPTQPKAGSLPNCCICVVEAAWDSEKRVPEYEVKQWGYTGHLHTVTAQAFVN